MLASASSGGLGDAIDRISDLAYRRRLIKLNTELSKALENGEEIPAAIAALSAVSASRGYEEPSFQDAGEEFYDDLLKRPFRESISSGIATLDHRTPNWLHPGHMVVVAARPGMGKSAFSQQIAEHVAKTADVLLVSIEMTRQELVERSIARNTGIPVAQLQNGNLDDAEKRLVRSTLDKFSHYKLIIADDVRAYSQISQIETRARTLARRCNLKLLVIDYLQLLPTEGKNRPTELGQITSALKRLARELDICVIVISQLNRNVESRQDKRPSLSDLKESGAIEQDADAVFMIYRDDYYNEKSLDKGVAEVICEKNRHGETTSLKLAFVGAKMLFADLAEDQKSAKVTKIRAVQTGNDASKAPIWAQ